MMKKILTYKRTKQERKTKQNKDQNSKPTRKAVRGHFDRQISNSTISHDKYPL